MAVISQSSQSAAAVLPPRSLSQPDFGSRWRVFWAVARREWTIFLRYPSWIVSLLVWPLIFPAAYILGARALAGPDGSGLHIFQQLAGEYNYAGYIVVGTTIWMWQNMVLWSVGFALRDEQRRGTLETNWTAPAWRFAYLLGSSAVQLFLSLVMLVVSALEYALLLGVQYHGNPLLVLLMVLACVPSIYGLGFAFASLVIAAKEANTFVFLVRGLVMVFCGITYPVLIMPAWMQNIAAWIPPTYMISGIRKAALGGADLQALLPELRALLLFGVLWLAVGYALFNWMERRARQLGSIGHF